MTSSNVSRARARLVLANLLVIAGFGAVLPLMLVAFLPGAEAAPLLQYIPWMPGGLAMPILVALAGLTVMFAGSAIASRQRRVLDAEQRRRGDALRRAHFYRGEGRIEPTLGPQQ